MTTAHKSGGAREEYNARRAAGHTALERLGLNSYREADPAAARRLESPIERDSYLHVTTERERVEHAVSLMKSGDAEAFGAVLCASHDSLRTASKSVAPPSMNSCPPHSRPAPSARVSPAPASVAVPSSSAAGTNAMPSATG
jgi:galactokinase